MTFVFIGGTRKNPMLYFDEEPAAALLRLRRELEAETDTKRKDFFIDTLKNGFHVIDADKIYDDLGNLVSLPCFFTDVDDDKIWWQEPTWPPDYDDQLFKCVGKSYIPPEPYSRLIVHSAVK